MADVLTVLDGSIATEPSLFISSRVTKKQRYSVKYLLDLVG